MKKDTKEFIDESGLIFSDISVEEVREYHFPNQQVLKISNPMYLHVSATGGHRVYSEDGYSWYVQPKEGWYIKWYAKDGEPNFVM